MFLCLFYCYVYHRDLHVLTHSFPTRRSADLRLATSQLKCRGTPACGLPFFENSRGTEAWIPNSTVPFHDGRLSPAAVDLHWRHSCRCGQPAPLRHPVTRLSPLRVARL